MLSQAYHWSLEDIQKLSYVQVLLLQHAASFNRKLLDKRLEAGRAKGTLTPTEDLADSDLYGGKKLHELSSDDLMAMAGRQGARPKVIKIRKDPDGPTEAEQSERRDPEGASGRD